MTKWAAPLALLAAVSPFLAIADPAQDRRELLEHYRTLFPAIRLNDYIYGRFSFDLSARRQYDDIMSFPPFAIDLEQGRQSWETPFANGGTFSSCFENQGRNVAGNYPYYAAVTRRVVTFENAINACLEKHGEPPLEYGGRKLALITAYARSLSDAMKVSVTIAGREATAAYLAGKRYYFARRGKKNISCASCHVERAGSIVNGARVSMLVGQASHYPEFIGGTDPMTLQQRMRQCDKSIGEAPLALNSEVYNELEYFMTYMSDGLPMQTPVFR